MDDFGSRDCLADHWIQGIPATGQYTRKPAPLWPNTKCAECICIGCIFSYRDSWGTWKSFSRGVYRSACAVHQGDLTSLQWKLCRKHKRLTKNSLRNSRRSTSLNEEIQSLISSHKTSFHCLWSLLWKCQQIISSDIQSWQQIWSSSHICVLHVRCRMNG